MRIQHNIPAMNSYRNFTTNNSKLNKNLEKLSSGYAINRAGDDAAGLAISEKMRAQITGLEVAQKNAKDGISVVQTAEGALTEVHDMLNRMYSLVEQSANGIYSSTERQKLQDEVDQLTSEINRIADSTNFNGINLLNGDLAGATSAGGSVSTSVTGIAAKNSQTIKGTYASYEAVGISFDKTNVANKCTTGTTYTMSFKYTDKVGKEQEYSITLTQATNSKATYETSSGKKGSVNLALGSAGIQSTTAATAGGALATAFKDAIINADDSITDDFNVSVNGTALKFQSSVTGTSGAQFAGGKDATGAITLTIQTEDNNNEKVTLLNVDLTQQNDDPSTGLIKHGIDRTTAYKLTSDNVWDVSTRDNLNADKLAEAAFTVGGKKFVMLSGLALDNGAATKAGVYNDDAEVIALMKDAGIDGYITLNENDTALLDKSKEPTEKDVAAMIDKIKDVTGLEIQQGMIYQKESPANTGTNNASDYATWGSSSSNDVYWGTPTVRPSTSSNTYKDAVGFVVVGSSASNANATGGDGLVLQIGDTADSFNRLNVNIDDMHAKALFGTAKINIVDEDNATAQQLSQKAMTTIKNAIDKVSTTRGNLGAMQNRLEHTINNLSTTRENLQDAESTIRDVDVAEEMMRYTKNNIMNQSAQAMLAQANQLPQGVLQLLQ